MLSHLQPSNICHFSEKKQFENIYSRTQPEHTVPILGDVVRKGVHRFKISFGYIYINKNVYISIFIIYKYVYIYNI